MLGLDLNVSMSNLEVSNQQLKALSLELGATVELPGGKVFNASGVKGEPPVSRPKQQVDYMQQLLSQLVSLASAPKPEPVSVPAPNVTVQVPEAKQTSWRFSFVRNEDGTIKDIIAKPVKE